MSLTSCFVLVYCISVIHFQLPVSAAVKCYSCASPVLRENWEVTGLPDYPRNGSASNNNFFSASNCNNLLTNADKVDCSGNACFFGAYALITGEYAVVRGCVEEFVGTSGITPNTGTASCELATGTHPVYIDKEKIAAPIVGWYTCINSESCNSLTAGSDTATSSDRWSTQTIKCSEPLSKLQCIACEHFDGEGKCHHNSKYTCQGNYCTKLVGKLNGRWFEIRGCAPLSPLGIETCVDTKKDIVIEQMGTTINQSYWSTSCVCKGDKCNNGMQHMLSFSALLVCLLVFFKLLKF